MQPQALKDSIHYFTKKSNKDQKSRKTSAHRFQTIFNPKRTQPIISFNKNCNPQIQQRPNNFPSKNSCKQTTCHFFKRTPKLKPQSKTLAKTHHFLPFFPTFKYLRFYNNRKTNLPELRP